MQLVNSTQLKERTAVRVLVFGQPGIGKTTLALSAPQPALIDFDGGVTRVDYTFYGNSLFAQPADYSDFLDGVTELCAADSVKTIVIDTVGKLLASMDAYIATTQPTLVQRDGQLTLKGFGARKKLFQTLLEQINNSGKHVVLIAHEKQTKIGGKDDSIAIPEIGGSSYNDIAKDVDLIGYYQAIGGARVLSFNPSEFHHGKNALRLPDMKIPESDGAATNTALASIIQMYGQRLEERAAKRQEYAAEIEAIKNIVANITSAEEATAAAEIIVARPVILDSLNVARGLLAEKTAFLGLFWNKEDKAYKEAEKTEMQPVSEA